jgi:hypothetical protein
VHLASPSGGCRALKNHAYARNLCRNSIYTRIRAKDGTVALLNDVWRLFRTYVASRPILRDPTQFCGVHFMLGCLDGFKISRLPQQLPLHSFHLQ